ncbi:DUF411 domain-containing protein [Candidatus Woesearchaeota archaeon]|nr:DUF411 domain-containing protein [Candidatus Woesearchaeota archaeon]
MKRIIILLLAAIFVIAACTPNQTNVVNDIGKGQEVTVFKSPTCGCCVGYATELEKNGFKVKTINTPDMSSIKQKYGIPSNMESCHTSIIGDYVVEGHVPIEAVQELLQDKPDISGIALPNMPAGTPGMPGTKRGPYVIYSLSDGSEFKVI